MLFEMDVINVGFFSKNSPPELFSIFFKSAVVFLKCTCSILLALASNPLLGF